MLQQYIPFRKTGYFSSLICDYLDEKSDLNPFYNRFPEIDNFKAQIEEKIQSVAASESHRNILVSTLKKQYQGIDSSESTVQNIESLLSENTFTITTGHQLNLFTGPLYFLYKIIATINLSKELKVAYPDYNFVPIYWMATEDHDFEEINYFNFKGKKFLWNRDAGGAVGELSTKGLEDVFDVFSEELGVGVNADKIKELFRRSYLEHVTLADATRFLANELFKDYGLVIIDANVKGLKRLFIPHIKDELMNQAAFDEVSKTNSKLTSVDASYKVQVNPRAINLFYLKKGLRERIIFEDNAYRVVNTKIAWSKDDILDEVSNYPERFSPNVIMRPLYQEVVLPNLCYIGGGGELAYWLQLKSYFNKAKVTYPILLLRNSVLIQTEKQYNKLLKLNISKEGIFLKRDAFINKKVREISNLNIDFTEQKKYLQKQFDELYKIAEETDKSFLGTVKAQEAKQIKGLENLEKRLLKAQKIKLSDQVVRMTDVQNELFPSGNLQERNTNFSELYLEFGEKLMPYLVNSLSPLKQEFLTLSI